MIVPGDNIPYFELPGTDGTTHATGDWTHKRVLVVIFTCNHCPYAQAYEDRIIKLQEKFGVQGVQFVAINSNDSEGYPEDSFAEMQKRAKKKKFNFPYLRDKTQVMAQKFGAKCTPEVYVFDRKRKCRYRGRIDDNWREPEGVRDHTLKDAISDVLAGKKPTPDEQPALGCTIKWQ